MLKHYAEILPAMEKNMNESHSFDLVLDCLAALRRIYRSSEKIENQAEKANAVKIIGQGTEHAVSLIGKALNHEYSKVIAEGLRVAASFVHALRDTITSTHAQLVGPIFQLVYEKLSKADIDQEVKQCSLICMAEIVSAAHSKVSPGHLDSIVTLFGDRLDSELTRNSSLKGLSKMAQAPQKINLNHLPAVMNKLLPLLRKKERTLHLHTFDTMTNFLTRYGD
jgi:hypothetical protein